VSQVFLADIVWENSDSVVVFSAIGPRHRKPSTRSVTVVVPAADPD